MHSTRIIPKTEPLRREWIKFQLRAMGTSLAKLAREQGVSRQAAVNALTKPYPKLEAAIAAAIGLEPRTIWPERYDSSGTPNRRRGRLKKSVYMNTNTAREPSACATENRRAV